MEQRRVVCAALLAPDGTVVCGARHYDKIMQRIMFHHDRTTDLYWHNAEQGFIDQYGVFLTREEAYKVASAAGQIIRRCGGDDGKLFSENLY